ncbi:unnamed protein product [Nezara viridula]|uniref:Gustatory receptor n=1 Tax=Nezara viridula TaxID=85310 RepID=A0A9P0ML99_NEZVI|nr:unnamed protein product [Nezara viridula]
MHITTVGTSIWRVRALRRIIVILEEVDAFLNIHTKMDFDLSEIVVTCLNFLVLVWRCYNTQYIIYTVLTVILVTNLWLAIAQFSVLASLINSRLEGACESLDELKMRSDSPYKGHKVVILSDVHNKLCDAIEILHTAFAWLLTVLVAVCFVGITVFTFYTYGVLKRNENFDILLLFQDETVLRSYFFGILSVTATLSIGFIAIGLNYWFISSLSLFEETAGQEFLAKAELIMLLCFINSLSMMHITAASTSIWRGRAVREIINILDEVDASLNNRSKMDFGPSDLVASCLNFFVVVWRCCNSQGNIVWPLYFSVLSINLWLAIAQFSVLASLINSRLEAACESLNELKMRSDSPYKDQKVAILSDVHNKLCDAGEILHTAFAWLLTVLVAVCCLGIIALTFYMYGVQRIIKYFDIRLLLFEDDKVLWIICFFTITWKIAASASELTQKVVKLLNYK